jgi:hypothetical protein
MEFVVHILLAFAFALILAPLADRLREMWQNSLSTELTIFLAPRPDHVRGRKRHASARRGERSSGVSGKVAPQRRFRGN